jgi:hypothetical protein
VPIRSAALELLIALALVASRWRWRCRRAYRARSTHLNRDVARNVLRGPLADDGPSFDYSSDIYMIAIYGRLGGTG